MVQSSWATAYLCYPLLPLLSSLSLTTPSIVLILLPVCASFLYLGRHRYQTVSDQTAPVWCATVGPISSDA